MKIPLLRRKCSIACLLLACSSLSLLAQTATWQNADPGNWQDSANWSWTGTVPDTSLPDTNTTVLINAGTAVVQDTTQSAGILTMNTARLEITKGSPDGTGGVLGVSGTFHIGSLAGRTGSVLVDGLGSILNKTGSPQMHIGSSGTGSMVVSNEGRVNVVGTTHIGLGTSSGATGVGTLTVNTAGRYVSSSTFILGYRGNGTLNVESAGYVKTGSSFIGGYGQDANRRGGTGTVNVTGAGSRWELGIIYVGHSGTGTMNIEDSGVVASTSTAVIGHFNFGVSSTAPAGTVPTPAIYGTGTVNIRTGGLWQSTANITIGANGGTGTMNLASAGSVLVNSGNGTITLGDLGSLNIGADPLLPEATPAAPGIVSAATITGATDRAVTLFHNDMTGAYHLTKTGAAAGVHVNLAGSMKLQALAGVTSLIGANAYTGGTLISGTAGVDARLILSHATALGSGPVLVQNNGTLEVSTGVTTTLGSLTLEGGSALAFDAHPIGGTDSPKLEISTMLTLSALPGEKITIHLNNAAAITDPELYDWAFLRTTGGITGYAPTSLRSSLTCPTFMSSSATVFWCLAWPSFLSRGVPSCSWQDSWAWVCAAAVRTVKGTLLILMS